jgi:hypothetical protein
VSKTKPKLKANRNQILDKYTKPVLHQNPIDTPHNSRNTLSISKKHSDASSKNSLRNRRNNRLVQVLDGNNNSPMVSDNKQGRDSSNSSTNIEQNVVYNLMRQNTNNSKKPSSDKSKMERSVSNKTCDDARNDKNSSPLLKVPRPQNDRKDSDLTNRTVNEPDINRKFSQLKFGPASNYRSRSFMKPEDEPKKHKRCKRKHRKHKSDRIHNNCKTR